MRKEEVPAGHELCLSRPFITTTYVPAKHIIVGTWQGFAPSKEFRAFSEDMIQLIRNKGCGYVLNDFRGGKAIHPDDQAWISDEWYPRAIEAGLSHYAFLLSQNVFNQLAVKRINEDIDQPGLNLRYFDNYEEAEQWLVEAQRGPG